ncbi:MAG TPA: ABC transporter permease [Pyrinomonadaceae bacterium]|nr:ABC transporter permease [Pyrinomonadaceae bacterium]
MMESLVKDLRFAFRSVLKNRAFSAAVIVTLGLGIGANTAIFTVVDASLLRSLPYREPERLVHLWETNQKDQSVQREYSYPDYLDLKQQDRLFEDVGGYSDRNVTLSYGDAKERRQAVRVTSNFFTLLGVEAELGRTFSTDDDRSGVAGLVVLSDGFWQRRFGGDRSILGKPINLNGIDCLVLGILPERFKFAPVADAELWIPLTPSNEEVSRRYQHWLNVVARLKPDVTVQQANSGAVAVATQFQNVDPQYHKGAVIKVVPLREQIVGPIRPLLFVLLGSVAFVLLIACSNVANLLLVRSTARHQEIAIRLALGATRWRLVRQLLTETVVLASLGGLFGLLLVRWGVDLVLAAIPALQRNFEQSLSIDSRALAFTATISLLTGIVFGVVPGLRTSNTDIHTLLRGGKRSAGDGGNRIRKLLSVAEIALAMVLLIGAGLMLRSLWRLMQVNPGFNPQNVITFQLSLPAARYQSADKAGLFYQQYFTRLESLPGVKGAGAVNKLPLVGGTTGSFQIEGERAFQPGQEPRVNLRTVSYGYFHAMEIPLLYGRNFTESDNPQSPPVLIVNHTLAQQVFSGNPVGKRLKFPFLDNALEVVGVAGDEKVGPQDGAITPVAYFPLLQDGDLATSFVVRSSGDHTSLVNAARQELKALDSDLFLYHVESMEHHIANRPATVMRRGPGFLIFGFACVALLLALIGIYGVISYSVQQRTTELGIRIALGAERSDILKLVLKQALALMVTGSAIGLVVALALTRFLSTMLFEVNTKDPTTFGAVVFLLSLVTLLAAYLPARRATRVDPIVALRYE